MNLYADIVAHCVEQALAIPRPALVAVTGESGSGKSYFTKLLREEFMHRGAAFSFVNHDDFLIPRAERESLRSKLYNEGIFKGRSHWEVLENWYYLDEFHDLLKKLKRGEPASYHPYVHDSGEVSNSSRTVEPNGIILLENKLFLDEMDLIIELRVDRQTIIQRKIVRDSDVRTPAQTIEMHEKAQGYYWDRNKPTNPHIIIDNNDFLHPKLIAG